MATSPKEDNRGHVLVILGAQYGSEGKGVVINHLANRYRNHIRVGGSNAGHTFSYRGQKLTFRQLPCGWTNPEAELYIGRGALIDFNVLRSELEVVREFFPDINSRVFIDIHAGVVDREHRDMEGGVNGDMHFHIGSTGVGVGAARAARVSRKGFRRVVSLLNEDEKTVCIPDVNYVEGTPRIFHEKLLNGENILIEGTQGCGLSLIHGRYPYVTSHDISSAQLLADTGIAPSFVRTLLVARSYPIRVGGNSGPMKNEIDFERLSWKIGVPVLERTTVTKKIRRIAEWDEELFGRAVFMNDPVGIAFTFADYLDMDIAGVTAPDSLSEHVLSFVEHLEDTYGIPVVLVGTGGPEFSMVEMEGFGGVFS